MRFWDSSGLVPLFVTEPASPVVLGLLEADAEIVCWWAAAVECASAFARARRGGQLDPGTESELLSDLDRARATWSEILPHENVRRRATQLVRLHDLRSADAFQLAAALAWTGGAGGELVTLDRRLAQAARLEGLVVVPA